MANVAIPHVFVQNTPARASEVNDNFSAVIAQVNGNLDSSNLVAGAVTEPILGLGAVTESRLATDAVTNSKIKDGEITDSKFAPGPFQEARIPNLNANKVTSGTLGTDRIPGLDTSKITSGTFANSRLANMDSQRIKGRLTAGSGPPEDLTQAQMQTFLGISGLIAGAIPAGIITMWSGSVASIPSGWTLCNGSNGTPDLRGRFIIGAGGSYNPGNTGGSESVTLTTANLAAHTHSVSGTTATDGSHNHGGNTSIIGDHTHSSGIYNGKGLVDPTTTTTNAGTGSGSIGFSVWLTQPLGSTFGSAAGGHSHTISTTGSTHSHSISLTSGSTGSATAHENRPPYYALAYIMKL
jgi:microcystin-dependent protein